VGDDWSTLRPTPPPSCCGQPQRGARRRWIQWGAQRPSWRTALVATVAAWREARRTSVTSARRGEGGGTTNAWLPSLRWSLLLLVGCYEEGRRRRRGRQAGVLLLLVLLVPLLLPVLLWGTTSPFGVFALRLHVRRRHIVWQSPRVLHGNAWPRTSTLSSTLPLSSGSQRPTVRQSTTAGDL